jgi:hypothetical protein
MIATRRRPAHARRRQRFLGAAAVLCRTVFQTVRRWAWTVWKTVLQDAPNPCHARRLLTVSRRGGQINYQEEIRSVPLGRAPCGAADRNGAIAEGGSCPNCCRRCGRLVWRSRCGDAVVHHPQALPTPTRPRTTEPKKEDVKKEEPRRRTGGQQRGAAQLAEQLRREMENFRREMQKALAESAAVGSGPHPGAAPLRPVQGDGSASALIGPAKCSPGT